MAFKHVGRIIANKRKVIVAYRVVPGDPDSCLVVQTENLSADEHDSLIKAVESAAGQDANEFGEAMARVTLPDGRNMLAGFHTTGKIRKVPTESVEMTPTNNDTVKLSELNKLIADQQGVTIADLAIKGPDGKTIEPLVDNTETVDPAKVYTDSPAPATAPTDGVMSDSDLAATYRSQADSLFKEAKQLREQAEELVPTKRKSSKKTVDVV